MSIIFDTLNALETGEPISFQNMEMNPLIAKGGSQHDYLTLDEALQSSSARISEISDGGNVPELTFLNEGEKSVLLMDGEELVGAKQNRILNLSILAPAGETITIPVSCVEAGRWSYSSERFSSGFQAQYPSARADKSVSVSENIRDHKSRRSNQSEIWHDISAKSARMSARSATDAMSEMYEKTAVELDQFVDRFKHVDGQCGFVFIISGAIAGLDLFDKPETLMKLMPKLVRSYALDALDVRRDRHYRENDPSTGSLDGFLSEAKNAPMEAFPAVGVGDDYRAMNGGISGGALVVDGTVVHLGLFPVKRTGSKGPRSRGSNIARASQRGRNS